MAVRVRDTNFIMHIDIATQCEREKSIVSLSRKSDIESKRADLICQVRCASAAVKGYQKGLFPGDLGCTRGSEVILEEA